MSAKTSPSQVKQMVAAEGPIRSKALEEEISICSECFGTGVVSLWSEIAYFEERRACARCEAGRGIDSKIADIVRRAQLEERLAHR